MAAYQLLPGVLVAMQRFGYQVFITSFKHDIVVLCGICLLSRSGLTISLPDLNIFYFI